MKERTRASQNTKVHGIKKGTWISAQIGARDHYAIPRALQLNDSLALLLTDAWLGSWHPSSSTLWGRSLSSRWDAELERAEVLSPLISGPVREIYYRLLQTSTWRRIHLRNRWFQRWAVIKLKSLRRRGLLSEVTHCFAYSYAAKEIFAWCKSHGVVCVLGQVDPGLGELEIVRRLRDAYPEWGENSEPPQKYWEDWHVELKLADRVIA